MPSARDELTKIVNSTRQMLLGQLLLPHIDKLKMIHVSDQPTVTRELLFYLMETDESELGLADPGSTNTKTTTDTQNNRRGTVALVKASAKFDRSNLSKKFRVLTAEEDEIWADLSVLIKTERRRSLAQNHVNDSSESEEEDLETMQTQHVSTSGENSSFVFASDSVPSVDSIKAIDLIITAVSSSVSPMISRTQANCLIARLGEQFEDEDELNRNDFVLLVRKWSGTEPVLASLDVERLSLFVFPEAEIEIYILRRLLLGCTRASQHMSYVSEISRLKLAEFADFREMVVFVPFLALFLAIVLSGKFVTPRTYYGANSVTLFSNLIHTAEFSRIDGAGASTGENIDLSGVRSTSDIYAFLLNGVAMALWPDSGTAGSKPIGNMNLVGAIKLRTNRVISTPGSKRAQTLLNQTGLIRYEGLRNEANYTSLSMDTSSYAQYVLLPWDGNHHGTCTDLNGSDVTLGNSYYYSCSGYAAIIPFNTTREQFQTVVKGLFEQQWIDVATRAVFVSFMSFHPASTMLANTEVVIEIRAGGSFTSSFKTHPFAFFTLTSSSILLSALYYLFFVYLFALIARTLYLHFYVPYKQKIGFHYWHIADLVNYTIFLVSVISRIIWIARGKPEDPVWQIDHYPAEYESIRVLFNLIVTYDSFNVIVSVLGLIRYAKYVPGVKIVVGSLVRAAPDAAALMFIMFGAFMSMVMCANAAFGDSVVGYHTLAHACETLGEVFIGNYDYRSLHAAHPAFAFIYFFVFQIMFTMILINMFVAVFTDAFGDTVESAVDHKQIKEILRNNTRHTFELASLTGSLKSCFPVQTFKAIVATFKSNWNGTSPDPYNFVDYFPLLEKCFSDILTPEDIIKERLGLESDKQLNGVRLLAIFHMLQLLRKVYIPKSAGSKGSSDASENEASECTTPIFDFMCDMVGEFDFPLLLTYYVLVPQLLFGQSGEGAIIEILDGRKAWFDEVACTAIKAEEADQLELRVRAIVAEREGARTFEKKAPARKNSSVNRSMTMTAATPKAVQSFVVSLDHITKRLFFAIVCLARKEEVKSAKLTLPLFTTLLERCPDFPSKDLSPEDLWEHLRIKDVPEMRMKDLLPLAHELLGPQVLSAELRAVDIRTFEKVLAEKKKTLVTRAEFADIWFEVFQRKITSQLLDRYFSLFPDGNLDMLIFLSHARTNLSAHSFESFETSFVRKGKENTSSFMWFLFYIPFFSLVLFFLNIEHGDHLWFVTSFRERFPVEGTLPSDAATFLTASVDTIWPVAGAGAQPLDGDNEFVGSVRFRQHRVQPDECDRVYRDYFGNADTKAINWPRYLSGASEQAFYTARIKSAYYLLNKNLSCLPAYDFGQFKSTKAWDTVDGNPVITSSIPEVHEAFVFRSGGVMSDDDAIAGKSSQFGGGGWGILLNTSVPREYAVQAIQDLLNNKWLDDKTRVVVMELISFNLNLEKFARIRLGYEITGIGILNPIDSMYVVGLENAMAPLTAFLSAFMFILIVIYIINVFLRYFDIFKIRMKNYGDPVWLAPFMVFHTDMTIPLDLCIIFTFIVTYALRYGKTQQFSLTNGVQNNGMFPMDIANAATLAQTMTKLMGVNVFLVFLRFLAILSTLEQHIASFMKTLQEAADDLLSIISLWVFSIFTFTLSGVILFGYSNALSFNLQTQFFDLFNTASGGNPSYVDYKAARREAASVFYVIYIITSFFILYNMVVAVLTDKFSQVKESLYDDAIIASVIDEPEAFSVKGFILNHVLYREFQSIWYNLIYCFDVPFGLRNRNPRLLWDLLTRLWQQVDTGVPEQIVTAGSTLVALSYEAGRLQWAEAHEAAAKKNKADAEAAAEAVANPLAPKPSQDESEASPVASSFFKPDLLNPPSIKEQRLMHRHSFQKMNDAAAIRLTTVADRRVPLWEEYVFYRFGNERDCIHRYLVWLPSILLGISERSLWLNVLEQHFHFLMKREKYTVDLSESRLVQIYKLLPETNEIVITHLALAAEERDVLDQAFPED